MAIMLCFVKLESPIIPAASRRRLAGRMDNGICLLAPHCHTFLNCYISKHSVPSTYVIQTNASKGAWK